MIWLLPALLLLLRLPSAPGQDYSYVTNNGTITITRYLGPGGLVSIPGTLGGLTVTSIGDSAFSFCTSVTAVTIPDGVTNIGELAFISCSSLTDLGLPASVVSIGELAFKSCASLQTITVAQNNPAFSSLDGVLFDQAQATLVQYPEGRTGSSYAVPASVRSIGPGAFLGDTTLTSISTPTNLRNIDDAAFYGCSSLTNLTIPDGVTNIGVQAFWSCTGLENILIPDSVAAVGSQAFFSCIGLTNAAIGSGSIGDSAFTDCTNLVSVTIGDDVPSIGAYAFEYCGRLSRVALGSSLTNLQELAFGFCFDLADLTLPPSVEIIGGHAFEYCPLVNVSLPAGLASFGDGVFEYCASLTAINAEGDNPAYTCVDGVLFDKDLTRLIQYPEGKAGHSYVIPAGVTSIADTAFAFSFGLTSVTIPASVTNIETLAFYFCADLTGVFCQGNAPAVQNYAFDLDTFATVYYLPGATGWGPTFGGLPTALWNPQVQAGPAAFRVQTNRFGFQIVGTPNIPIVVEASSNLAGGPWNLVLSCTLTNGSFYFNDARPTTDPARFYRLRSP